MQIDRQTSASEKTFLFDQAELEAVAAIVRPRRRRRLSPEQRAVCTARLAKYRFQPAPQGEISARQAPIDPEDELKSA
jgi:hypothetical protein